MSTAEYISIMASVLLGLAIADLATSLHLLIRTESRVRWHWLPLLFAAVVLLSVVQFWWASYRSWTGIETIGEFLIPMTQLLLLFLLASAALPDAVSRSGVDLRAHYFKNHRYVWGLFAAYVATAVVIQLSQGIFLPLNVAGLLAMCALALWKTAWLHYVGLPLISTVPLNFLWLQIAA